jgi:CheY-like chemotaxis protein
MTTRTALGTVLLIDDDAHVQRLCRRVFDRSRLVARGIGFQLASDALDWLGAEGPAATDAIFLDVNMPAMDGFEFLDAAAARFGDAVPPVLMMLTTALLPRDRDRAGRFAALKGYVAKPLQSAHLAQALALANASRPA